MWRRALVPLLFLLLGACGADLWAVSSNTSSGGGFTFVVIWVSDSPVDGADSVFAGFDRVEIAGPGGTAVLSDVRQVHDLLALQNGNRARLAEGDIPSGTWSLLRLVLAPEASGVNRVVIGGVSQPLVFPSAGAATIEIPLAQTNYPDGGRSDIQVDMNARLSVLEGGGTWFLDPQTSLVLPQNAGAAVGRVVGAVGQPISLATVSAQQGGTEVLSTRTFGDGTFRLDPLPAGIYDVVVTATGYALAVDPAAFVTAAQDTPLGDIALTVAAAGTIQGLAPIGVGTSVRFFQNGALVGVAGIDPLTGAFSAPVLPPGTYDVRLWGPAGVIDTDPGVVLTPAGVALVDFTT